jgi:prepilin-type N-terminal cleavage/methylation domain-containing protein
MWGTIGDRPRSRPTCSVSENPYVIAPSALGATVCSPDFERFDMVARTHGARGRSDDGFSLIELLVVMIIISILASAAIPIFLNQKKLGYRTQLKSDLRNAAQGLESAAVDKAGDFTLVGQLEAGDPLWSSNRNQTESPAKIEFTAGPSRTLRIVRLSKANYCIEASSTNLPSEPWSYTKNGASVWSTGVAVQSACPATLP